MKMKPTKLTAATALLACTLPLSAASNSDANRAGSSQNSTPVAAANYHRGQSARELIGKNVTNRAGEKLGEIKDFVVDPKAGRVLYAIVGAGGFLGINEATRPVPLAALKNPADASAGLSLDMSRSNWEGAPTMAANRPDLLVQEDTARSTREFYERTLSQSFSETPRVERVVSVSEILGRDVANAGRPVGEIEDVIVHLDSRRASVLLDPEDDFTGTDQKFVVKFDQLMPARDENLGFQTNLTREEFSRAAPAQDNWWDASTHFPLAWTGYGTLAAPGYTATSAGIAPGHAPVASADASSDRAGKPSVTVIRGRVRSDPSLSENARMVTIEENDGRLVLSGTVQSDQMKDQVTRTISQFANGWSIDNRIRVQSASE